MGLLDYLFSGGGSAYDDFRRSDNIEDRRKQRFVPTPGVFGNGVDTGNVFDNGLLTGLKPDDFSQQSGKPDALSIAAGALDIGEPKTGVAQNISNSHAPVRFAGGTTDKIIGAESGGDPNATNPRSSATGAGQFIASTWIDTLSRERPDLVQGKSQDEILALRNDPQLSRQMTEAYAAQNGRILSQAGHEATPGNTYLAHFAGPQGAVSVLGADPSTPIDKVLTPAAIKANPFLQGMTAGDLRAWADRKMGGAQPASAPPAAPANGLLAQPSAGLLKPSAPMGLLPPQAPIFAPPPQAQLQQQAQEPQGDIFSQMQPPAQMQPLFAPQRRAPDLSKLRAAFRAPVFSRG